MTVVEAAMGGGVLVHVLLGPSDRGGHFGEFTADVISKGVAAGSRTQPVAEPAESYCTTKVEAIYV